MVTESRASALLHGKCPRCHQGDIFQFPLRNIRHFYKMNDRCPVCSVVLEPEPGFYQGAMYVSYAFTIAALITLSSILYVFSNPEEWVYIFTIISVMVAVAPVNYRYSRIIYLYFFGGIGFDKSWGDG